MKSKKKEMVIIVIAIICLIIVTVALVVNIISEEQPMKLKADITYHDEANMEMILGDNALLEPATHTGMYYNLEANRVYTIEYELVSENGQPKKTLLTQSVSFTAEKEDTKIKIQIMLPSESMAEMNQKEIVLYLSLKDHDKYLVKRPVDW
jgi:hypothetical protein